MLSKREMRSRYEAGLVPLSLMKMLIKGLTDFDGILSLVNLRREYGRISNIDVLAGLISA